MYPIWEVGESPYLLPFRRAREVSLTDGRVDLSSRNFHIVERGTEQWGIQQCQYSEAEDGSCSRMPFSESNGTEKVPP